MYFFGFHAIRNMKTQKIVLSENSRNEQLNLLFFFSSNFAGKIALWSNIQKLKILHVVIFINGS